MPDVAVLEASSGFEALRLLPRVELSLVITDINMPDINGIELVRFLRRSERHSEVPVLIISTQASEKEQKRIKEVGADRFLPKPFEPEELVAVVEELCFAGSDSDPKRET